MPASITDAQMLKVFAGTLFVERCVDITAPDVRTAVKTWLGVEDDPEVFEDDIAL